jgi:hypothetical protein
VKVNDLFQAKNQPVPYLKAPVEQQINFSGRFEGT